MHYLVFGATGFLGTNLCLRLLSQGHEVTGVDDFTTSPESKLNLLKDHNNFKFFNFSINDATAFEKCSFDQIDYIFNLACPASPPQYSSIPLYTLDTCYIGVKNILELALKYNIPVLQASTSEIYGNPLVNPQKESYFGNVNTMGPRSCYDEGKRVAETLCYIYSTKGVRVHIARIFNTYGPYMELDDKRVISEFIVNALKDLPLVINGDGCTTRSFCYVDDLIEVLTLLSDTPSLFGIPVNLGNPEEIPLEALAYKIIVQSGSQSAIVYNERIEDDPRVRRPDISIAKSQLGWEPKIYLQEGLERTIDYFKNILL